MEIFQKTLTALSSTKVPHDTPTHRRSSSSLISPPVQSEKVQRKKLVKIRFGAPSMKNQRNPERSDFDGGDRKASVVAARTV